MYPVEEEFMAEEKCLCEICAPAGLGLLQEGSRFVNSKSDKNAYGEITNDYADYFFAYGEIPTLGGKSKKGVKIYPGAKLVSEKKGYVPPYLRGVKKEELPFYKKYVSGTDDIYAYKGKKFGMAKYFESSRIPSSARKAIPNVEGYAIRKKYNAKKRKIGFWCSFVPFVVVVLVAILLFV